MLETSSLVCAPAFPAIPSGELQLQGLLGLMKQRGRRGTEPGQRTWRGKRWRKERPGEGGGLGLNTSVREQRRVCKHRDGKAERESQG